MRPRTDTSRGQTGRPVSGTLNAGNISVNGQRETANAFLVNGGDVSEGRNLGAGLVPNLDSVEEFRLITNSFDAEYGKFSGAVMNAITKSGTNGFHGDVFEFLRNDKIDANELLRDALSKTALHRNQFGAVGGGPIWKDHLFWFADYQGTRQTQGAETGLVTLPTADERQGNFDPTLLTGTVDGPLTGTGGAQSWAQVLSQRLGYPVTPGEPYSFAACTATTQLGLCFPGPVAAANIPAVRLVSTGQATSSRTFPRRLSPGTEQLLRTTVRKTRGTTTSTAERVDFNNQDNRKLVVVLHLDDSTVDNALPFASVPGFPIQHTLRAQQFVMSNAKTFGATAVNESRFSFFRTAFAYRQSGRQFRQPVVARFRDWCRHPGHYSFDNTGLPGICATDLLQQLRMIRRAHAQHLPARITPSW